jgi:hypothetical protein
MAYKPQNAKPEDAQQQHAQQQQPKTALSFLHRQRNQTNQADTAEDSAATGAVIPEDATCCFWNCDAHATIAVLYRDAMHSNRITRGYACESCVEAAKVYGVIE